MNDCERGKIRNREYASQLRDFSGLRFGRITPTDIDGFMDFNNKAFVFIEAKHGVALPKTGQRLALERVCDACESAGKSTLVLVASHTDAGDIQFASIPVAFIRHKGKWRTPRKPTTVREAIETFLEWCGLHEYSAKPLDTRKAGWLDE